MKRNSAILLLVLVCLCALPLAGCSTDDNPVTPEKMDVMRKKQTEEMKGLSQTGKAPEKPPTK